MLWMNDPRSIAGGFGIINQDFGSSKDKKRAETGIREAGEQAYQRAAQTGEEKDQYSKSFQLGDFLRSIYLGQQGLGDLPEGYMTGEDQIKNQGDLGKAFYSQVLSETQDPNAYFQSTLQPELMAAQDTINSYYQKRGLLNSGLAIESMGRAGVDLAIKEAQARMASRQQALNNALQVSQYGANLANNNMSGLSNLYSTQQNAGLNSLSRQATGAFNNAQYQAYPHQAQLGNYYGGQAALHALPGQLLGAAAKVATAKAGGNPGGATA